VRERALRGRDLLVTSRRLQACAALAIGALLATRLAAAADGADAYNAALTRAIAAKERALDVNDPPRWEEALRLFQEAAALRATRESAYEIGFAAERLSRTDLAVESYEAAIELGLTGPAAARASAFAAAHVRALSRLDMRGPAGTRLRVAGVDRGRLPLRRPVVLFPGEIELELFDPRGLAWTVTARLKAGKNDVIDLAAGPPAETAAPPRAAPPTAPPRAAPPTAPAPAAAPPTLAAAPQPAAPLPVVVVAPIPRSPDEAPRATSGAAWPLVAIGLTVAVAGGVLIWVSQRKIDDNRTQLSSTCSVQVGDTCQTAINTMRVAAQSAEDAIATWKAVRLGSFIGLGVGAAMAVTGVALKLGGGGGPPVTALVVPDRDGRPSFAVAWRRRF
jgi:hypothetical protein